jgi:hypothetical protein
MDQEPALRLVVKTLINRQTRKLRNYFDIKYWKM